MKAMFQQFADSRLTREQMKEVKGGKRVCEATFYYGGTWMTITQNCYSGTTGACINGAKAEFGNQKPDIAYDHATFACDLV